jgi:hypothetical protein
MFSINGLALVALLAATAAPARSQGYPFSQRGSVSQHVALTEITIDTAALSREDVRFSASSCLGTACGIRAQTRPHES